MEVLSLVRSLKNLFPPINQISPEVLSLIPDYFDQNDVDQDLIALTHVCHYWRDVFTFRSSLWTHLDFTNVNKTRAYIERSKFSPLKIRIKSGEGPSFSNDAFSLVLPHLHKLKSLDVSAGAIPDVFEHFRYHAPLLKELTIHITGSSNPVLDNELFIGDLSSLRKLSLGGVKTDLRWKNVANLQVFTLKSRNPRHNIAQLLDFFESAPLLHTIELQDVIPRSSNASPERILPLLHLNTLRITADPPHSILLNHLSIPTGALLIQEFIHRDTASPLLDYLPVTSANLKNLSHTTTINLRLDPARKFLKLTGPSGGLYMFARSENREVFSSNMDRRILHSLGSLPLWMTQRLTFSNYHHPHPTKAEISQVFQTLSWMNDLQTLVLVECSNLPFILALDPVENPGELSCPHLEEFVLYIKSRDQFHTEQLICMGKNRASRGTKLPSITVVDLGELAPKKGVLKLREHVARVEYRIDDVSPAWDDVSGECRQKASE